MGDGAASQTGSTPATEAASAGSLPHAETPDARAAPEGEAQHILYEHLCTTVISCLSVLPSLSLPCPSLPFSFTSFLFSLVPSPPPPPLQEVELQARRDQFRLEELRQQHLLEKRQLPKRLKADHKLQVAEARKAARNKKDESSKEKLRKVRVGRQSPTWETWRGRVRTTNNYAHDKCIHTHTQHTHTVG